MLPDGGTSWAVPDDVLHVFNDLVFDALGVLLAVRGARGAIGVALGGSVEPLLGHEGASDHELPGADFTPLQLGPQELLDDSIVGFELGVLTWGGAEQERTSVLMVDLAVDVGKVFSVLLGALFALSTPGFKPFGDGVPGGPAQVVRKPGACLLYTSPSPRDQRGSRMPSSA